MAIPKPQAFTVNVQTDAVKFEPGDGDSFFTFARVLFGDEAKRFNASPGDVMVFMQYGRGPLMIRCMTNLYGNDVFGSDIVKWAGEDRQATVMHQVFCYLTGAEVVNPRATPEQMGWRPNWREQLINMKEEVETIRAFGKLAGFIK